jgi:hypothetical protein
MHHMRDNGGPHSRMRREVGPLLLSFARAQPAFLAAAMPALPQTFPT